MTALATFQMFNSATTAAPRGYCAGSALEHRYVVDLWLYSSNPRFPEFSTKADYWVSAPPESTNSGTSAQPTELHIQSTAEAILEIRRRSGLTWNQLSDLFSVSRRSVHHWANGMKTSADHADRIFQTLAAIRHIDHGSQVATRDRLLAIRDRGFSCFALLKKGCFDKVLIQARGPAVTRARRLPLSLRAQEERKPTEPMRLLEAEDQRPEIPVSKVRIAQVRRTQKKRRK